MFNPIGVVSGPIVILGVVGMAFLTKPAVAPVCGLGERSPAVGKASLETAIPYGATIMVSSVPVEIQDQVGKNIIRVNIPNDNGGYSTVILQK